MNAWRAPTLPTVIPEGQHSFPILDAAVLCAVSKCWLARQDMPVRITNNHSTCVWCDYPPDILMASICGFWRSYPAREECERFGKLLITVQQRLVTEAAQPE